MMDANVIEEQRVRLAEIEQALLELAASHESDTTLIEAAAGKVMVARQKLSAWLGQNQATERRSDEA